MPEAIQVWSFYDAPQEYRDLSPHGGDEDWVALLPKKYVNRIPYWMESGTAFGACDVSNHPLPDGRMICIGAHS